MVAGLPTSVAYSASVRTNRTDRPVRSSETPVVLDLRPLRQLDRLAHSGSGADVAGLVRTFAEATEDRLTAIRAAAGRGDAATVVTAAHNLRGSAWPSAPP